jgi:hypothetical protein
MPQLKNLSPREWIFIVLILSLVQGVIWYVSFVNAKNGTALNYVSFAGTLISIILAVLAIGYTYGESLSEKNKSNALANQISTLNEVIKNISIQSSSLDKITLINEELLQLANNFREGMSTTHSRVDDVRKAIDKLLDASASQDSSHFNKEKDLPFIKVIGQMDNLHLRVVFLYLYYLQENTLSFNKMITGTVNLEKQVKDTCNVNNVKFETTDRFFFYGSVLSVFVLFRDSGLLDEPNDLVKLNPSVVSIVQKILEEPLDESNKGMYQYCFFEVLRNRLTKRDN